MRREHALIAVAMVYPTLAAWLYFSALAGRPVVALLYPLAKVVQAALPLVGWKLLGLPVPPAAPGRSRGLAVGVLSGVGLGLPVLGLYRLLAGAPQLAGARQAIELRLEPFGGASVATYLAVALALSLVHSLFEEYYWRWFLQGELHRHLSAAAAVTLASLAFAAHHVVVVAEILRPGGSWFLVAAMALSVAVAGAVWGQLYRRRSLLAAWISHVVVDLAVFTIGGYLLWA